MRAGHCSKGCSRSRAPRGLAARRRRRGDTDETTWTWWTLPPPIAGCLAQRYHGTRRSLCLLVASGGSGPYWTHDPLRCPVRHSAGSLRRHLAPAPVALPNPAVSISRRRLRRRSLGTSGGLWPWEARPPRAEPQRRDSQINTAHSAYRPGSVLLAAPSRSVPAHSDQTPGQYAPHGCPPGGRPFAVAPSATWGADDRRRCKAPHQTAARLWYASGTASRAAVTAGQRVQVTVPGQRTRKAVLDTFPPADRSAAVSPMGGMAARQEPRPGTGSLFLQERPAITRGG